MNPSPALCSIASRCEHLHLLKISPSFRHRQRLGMPFPGPRRCNARSVESKKPKRMRMSWTKRNIITTTKDLLIPASAHRLVHSPLLHILPLIVPHPVLLTTLPHPLPPITFKNLSPPH